jgi:phage gp36-like protein
MAYITTTQLSQRLGSTLYARLTDRVNGATADSAVAQQIVDEAEALANSHLSKRYAVPVSLAAHPELAAVLASRVLDIAEYLAWKSSPFVGDVPDRVRILHNDAMVWFESLAGGQLHLPATAPPASRTASDDLPRYTSEPRAFTHDELDGL